MPYAEDADTARRWAAEHVISCWARFRGELDEAMLGALRAEAAASKADGAIWVMIIRLDDIPSNAEHLLADEVVVGASPPRHGGSSPRCRPRASAISDGWAWSVGAGPAWRQDSATNG